jgi:simple sugar transport system permease protein
VLTLALALVAVIVVMTVIPLAIHKDPATVLSQFLDGAFGNEVRRSDVLMRSLPVLLCASGLLLTFTAGLWNIGVEGQMIMGAVFATIVARGVSEDGNAFVSVILELILGAIGGALWAGLAAILKTRGRVNEIFGGVALNFIALNIIQFLLDGPWKYQNYSQTAPFKPSALLPTFVAGQSLSIPAIVIAALAFIVVFIVLRGTHWGLQLRATGRSERSAFLLGVRTERNVLLSMMACGALAGIAGVFQIISPVSQKKLYPDVSGGLGFLAVLIVLLVNTQPTWVPLITLFFGIVPVGMLKLQLSSGIDPSLGRVFQSVLVLIVVLANGIRTRLKRSAGGT